jgi:hypothetical protein
MSIPSAADINKLGFRVPYDPASGDKPQLQANGASKGGLRKISCGVSRPLQLRLREVERKRRRLVAEVDL